MIHRQEMLLVFAAALVVAAISIASACVAREECSNDGTCVAIGSVPTCDFATSVTMLGDLYYANANVSVTLAEATRGICAPGERLGLSGTSPGCHQNFPYPNALNKEIYDASSSTFHERYCGAWIDAGSASTDASYWSFSDEEARADGVRSTARSMAALPHTRMGRFREACESAVLAGAHGVRIAAEAAYAHLDGQFALDAANSTDELLHVLGVLAGHYCDAPVQMGVYSSSQSFVATMTEGTRVDAQQMFDALLVVGASPHQASAAFAASVALKSIHSDASTSATWDQLERVYEGATGRTDNEDVLLDTDELKLLSAFVVLSGSDPAAARAYLRGSAAHCATALGSSIDGRIGFYGVSARPRAEALGRLRKPARAEPMPELDNDFHRSASVVTVQQLVGAPTGDATQDCALLTEQLFPDDTDALWFSLAVPDALYDRMRTVTEDVRQALVDLLSTDATARSTVYNADMMVSDVAGVRVRIPGAPRGTWAGATRSVPEATLTSSGGVLVMALQQSRAVFLDRSTMPFTDAGFCEQLLPTGVLASNAFIYPSQLCSYFLLGMSMAPWAGVLFDEESLLSRFGYIVAHEMAHTSLNSGITPQTATGLLSRYAASTTDEAVADVLALMAVIRTGKVNASAACAHLSQLWCARVPPLYYATPSKTHPRANVRGNAGCETLTDLGYTV